MSFNPGLVNVRVQLALCVNNTRTPQISLFHLYEFTGLPFRPINSTPPSNGVPKVSGPLLMHQSRDSFSSQVVKMFKLLISKSTNKSPS